MKHFVCTVCVCLFFIGFAQAAEPPGVVEIRLRGGGFCSAVFSPDGKTIATAAKDNYVRIWNAEAGEEWRKFQHKDWVRTVQFSPDGKKIIAGGSELTPRIWEVESGKLLQQLEGHGKTGEGFGDWAHPAIFSPDGKKVLTAGGDQTARIWDAESGKELQKLEVHSIVRTIFFTPDGKRVITGSDDNLTRIWETESGKELKTLEGRIHVTHKTDPTVLSPDGKKIVTVTNRDCTARIWEVESGKELQKLEGHSNYLHTAAFSPDGKKIVTTSYDETARIWDAESGEELQLLRGDPNKRRDMRLHGGFMPGIRVEPGKVLTPEEMENRWRIAETQFDNAAFSPDGKRVFTTGNPHDRVIRIWDAESGKELHALGGHERELTISIHFSPDGKKIVTSAYSLTVLIWDLERLPLPVVRPAVVDF